MHVGDLGRHVDQAGQPGELLVQRRYDVVARWRGGGGVGGRDAGDALLDALDRSGFCNYCILSSKFQYTG